VLAGVFAEQPEKGARTPRQPIRTLQRDVGRSNECQLMAHALPQLHALEGLPAKHALHVEHVVQCQLMAYALAPTPKWHRVLAQADMHAGRHASGALFAQPRVLRDALAPLVAAHNGGAAYDFFNLRPVARQAGMLTIVSFRHYLARQYSTQSGDEPAVGVRAMLREHLLQSDACDRSADVAERYADALLDDLRRTSERYVSLLQAGLPREGFSSNWLGAGARADARYEALGETLKELVARICGDDDDGRTSSVSAAPAAVHAAWDEAQAQYEAALELAHSAAVERWSRLKVNAGKSPDALLEVLRAVAASGELPDGIVEWVAEEFQAEREALWHAREAARSMRDVASVSAAPRGEEKAAQTIPVAAVAPLESDASATAHDGGAAIDAGSDGDEAWGDAPSAECVVMPDVACTLRASCSTGSARLDIPAGAVSAPTRVCLAVRALHGIGDAATAQHGPLVALLPHGLQLRACATLQLHVRGISATAAAGADGPLLLLDHPGTTSACVSDGSMAPLPLTAHDAADYTCSFAGDAATLRCSVRHFCYKVAALGGGALGIALALAPLAARSLRAHARAAPAAAGVAAAAPPPSSLLPPPRPQPRTRAAAAAPAEEEEKGAHMLQPQPRPVHLSDADAPVRALRAPGARYDVMLSYRVTETGAGRRRPRRVCAQGCAGGRPAPPARFSGRGQHPRRRGLAAHHPGGGGGLPRARGALLAHVRRHKVDDARARPG
jgi:hypothetical protein